jgi:hypothetical protein
MKKKIRRRTRTSKSILERRLAGLHLKMRNMGPFSPKSEFEKLEKQYISLENQISRRK